MNKLSSFCVLLTLSGCAGVEVRYAAPQGFDRIDAARAAASRGLSYYSLAKMHISVVPVDPSPELPATQHGLEAKPEPPADTAPPSAKSVDGPQRKPSSNGAGNSDPHGKAPGSDTEGSNPKGPGVNKVSADTPPSAKPPAMEASGRTNEGQQIGVTLTARPDPSTGFLMGGTNGFWRKTAITASRAENSDRPDSVTVKAENLTATRFNQIATVLGYFINPSAPLREILRDPSGAPRKDVVPKDQVLKPFEFDVSYGSFNKEMPTARNSAWTYVLKVDAPEPDGAVSFSKFKAEATSGRPVNYFPVPACISAHLVLLKAGQLAASVPLVVSDPNIVRLEPLPLDGKLSLSSICGSSVQGGTQVDRYDEVFSDLAALQKAYVQVSKPSPPPPPSKPPVNSGAPK